MHTIHKYIHIFGLLLLSFIVCLHFPQNPFYGIYFGDTSVYEYVGKRITEGAIPYRDIFDHKGPIVYLWHALGYKIYPMYGAWLLEVIWLFLSLVLCLHIIKKYVSDNIAFFLTLFIPLIFNLFDTIGNTESLSLLPLTYFVYIAQQYTTSERLKKSTAFIIGFLCFILIMIKPNHLATPLIICLYIAISQLKNKKFKELLHFIIFGLTGFLLPTAIILLWLYHNNALPDFYNTYIAFNLLYTKSFATAQTYTKTLQGFFSLPEIIIAFVSMVIILIQRNLYSSQEKKFIYLIMTAYCFTFVINIIPKNIFPHYMFVLLPLTLLLCTFVIESFKSQKLQLTILEWLFIMALYLFHTHFIHNQHAYVILNSNYPQMVEIIQKHIKPHETYASTHVDYCALYLYSKRNSTTKYPIIEFTNRVDPQSIEEEYKTKKPAYILADIYHSYPNLITKDYELIDRYKQLLLYKRVTQ